MSPIENERKQAGKHLYHALVHNIHGALVIVLVLGESAYLRSHEGHWPSKAARKSCQPSQLASPSVGHSKWHGTLMIPDLRATEL